jgi:hypothetical protein
MTISTLEMELPGFGMKTLYFGNKIPKASRNMTDNTKHKKQKKDSIKS